VPHRLSLACAALLVLAACDDDPLPDPPPAEDAGPGDAGPGPDAGPGDAGPTEEECRATPDTTPPEIPDPGTPEPPPALDCGTPEILDGTSMWRWPYLEAITSSSVRVSWTTRNTGGRGVVRYAADPAGEWTEVEAGVELFEATRTAQRIDYNAYTADLTGLTPNAAYCYEIVEDGEVLARNLRFDTAWDTEARPVRALVLGDSGSGSENQIAIRDAFMERGEYDVFLHMGDMAYGSGRYDEFESNFFDIYQDLMHRVPIFPTIGNHEYITNVGRPYRDVYHTLTNIMREEDHELYYSFDYGNVHFVALDSNEATLIPIYIDVNDRISGDMFEWMVADLEASTADWNIIFMHHPFFSSSERGIRWNNIERFRRLLEEAGADLILVGHDHHYERSHPLYWNCNTGMEDGRGIPEIIVGGSGASIRSIDERGPWHTAATYNADYSYMEFVVHGCGLTGTAFNTANEVVDEFTLYGCDD